MHMTFSDHTVWFARCADYGAETDAAVGRILDESGLLCADAVRGKRVLVKPNLLTDRTPEQAVTTHPDILRAVLRRLKSAGAEVSVGDSPASTANLRVVLEKSGLGAVCAEEGAPFVSFERAGVRNFTEAGFSFSIANPVMETDLIVNLPKIKSHSLTKLTAAVKNLYGAVPGYSKTTLHRRYPKPGTFGRLLQAIWSVLPPCVSIADGVVGMEGQGPANGKPIRLGFVAASSDPFALDCAICNVLHIRPASVPYLKGADKTHAPNVRGDAIEVESFATPTGAHLLALLPAWFVRLATGFLWVRPKFDPALCISCGQCVRACPAKALVLEGRSMPTLDKKACIGCACCHEVCPKGAIRMAQSPVLRMAHTFKGLD